MTFHLSIRTPAAVVVEAEARALTAEDASGRFGVRPGIEPLVSVMVPSMLTYIDASGAEVLVAVGEGVLHAERHEVNVAVRSAVICQSLSTVREEILRAAADRREGVSAMRDAFRSLYRSLLDAMVDEERAR